MRTTLTLFQQANATTPIKVQPALSTVSAQSALLYGLLLGGGMATCLIACLCFRRAAQFFQSRPPPLATPTQTSNTPAKSPHTVAINIPYHELRSPTHQRAQTNSAHKETAMKKACLGGTFDHLHAGHKTLLDQAIQLCLKRKLMLFIGLSTDQLLSKKQHANYIESFDTRQNNLNHYIKSKAEHLAFTIAANHTAEGPLLTDPDIQVLICSNEPAVLMRCRQIQAARAKKGLPDLELHTVACLPSRSSDQKLSSSQIRAQLAAENDNNSPSP